MSDMTIDFAGPPGWLTAEQIALITAASAAVSTEAVNRIAGDQMIVNRFATLWAVGATPFWDALGELGTERALYLPLGIYAERAGTGGPASVTNSEASEMPGYCKFVIPDDAALHAILFNPAGPAYSLYNFGGVPLIPTNIFAAGYIVAAVFGDALLSIADFNRSDRELTTVSGFPRPPVRDLGAQLGADRAVYLPTGIYVERGKNGFGSTVSNPVSAELAGYVKLPVPLDTLSYAILYSFDGEYTVHGYEDGESLADLATLRNGVLVAVIWGDAIWSPFGFVTVDDLAPALADFALPPALWLTAGRPTALNLQNAHRARLEPESLIAAITSAASGKGLFTQSGCAMTLQPEAMGTVAAIDVRHGSKPTSRIRHSLAVNIAPATGTGARIVLPIGDSLTYRYMPALIKANLQGRGHPTTMLGSIATLGGEAGEGREGRQWAEYIRKVTGPVGALPDMVPVAPGGEAAYLALSSVDKAARNPFIRAATGGDDPDLVFNGYIFDLDFYLTRFGYADPTHVVIALGTNDLYQTPDVDQFIEKISDGFDVTVAQARAALPTAKIGIVQHVIGRGSPADQYWSRHHRMIRTLIAKVRALGDPGVAFIPSYLHQSMDGAWPLTTASTDPDTGTVSGAINDVIHFDAANRSAAAEAIASWVAVA
ncbi:SGNH/GDSL hydrolase family protein [Sphingobium yanoikuyae]|uniref:SGNH/GDSL hydrolase family protein n=1 Tax=Sphingobium yanoikuyae TaxID=13690 RepID=UPI002FDB24C8